jgi:anti-anti-sigma factor
MIDGDDFRGLLHGALRHVDGRAVYALSGDIDVVTGEPLVARVREIADGAGQFDLDMAEVGFVDSTGLRSLFHLHDVVTRRGGRLRLLSPSEPVMRLLELTDTADQFEIVRGPAV